VLTEEQKTKLDMQERAIADTIHGIRHRIIVLSGKGGVGKTTVSVNLAAILRIKGYVAGILDADVTGPNVPKMLGLTGNIQAQNGKIIPLLKHKLRIVSVANMIGQGQPVLWRGPMRSKLLAQSLADVAWGELDYLIADLPPGTGDEIITLTQKMKPELAIVVTTPQSVSLIDSERAINMAKKMNVPRIGLVENMSGLTCPHCGSRIDLFGTGGGKRQAKQLGVDFLGALPLDIDIRKTADRGRPVVLAHPDSAITAAMTAITDAVEKLLDRPMR
jgi:ATP-binding protein involved in chromosome partitioning